MENRVEKELLRTFSDITGSVGKGYSWRKICDGVYNEDIVRKKVKRIEVYEKRMIICFYEGEQYCVCNLQSS